MSADDLGALLGVITLCLLFFVAFFSLGHAAGYDSAEAEICQAVCGEHWIRETDAPCVCLEVSRGR